MKLTKIYLSELGDATCIDKMLDHANGEYGNSDLSKVAKAWDNYMANTVDAEIVTDTENSNIYDYRIFDPQHLVKDASGNSYFTNNDGWTNWMTGYEDNNGNDVNTIFDEHNGYAQA